MILLVFALARDYPRPLRSRVENAVRLSVTLRRVDFRRKPEFEVRIGVAHHVVFAVRDRVRKSHKGVLEVLCAGPAELEADPLKRVVVVENADVKSFVKKNAQPVFIYIRVFVQLGGDVREGDRAAAAIGACQTAEKVRVDAHNAVRVGRNRILFAYRAGNVRVRAVFINIGRAGLESKSPVRQKAVRLRLGNVILIIDQIGKTVKLHSGCTSFVMLPQNKRNRHDHGHKNDRCAGNYPEFRVLENALPAGFFSGSVCRVSLFRAVFCYNIGFIIGHFKPPPSLYNNILEAQKAPLR